MPNATSAPAAPRSSRSASRRRSAPASAPLPLADSGPSLAHLPEPHRSFFYEHDWQLTYSQPRAARPAIFRSATSLELHPSAHASLGAAAERLWRHQHIALRAWRRGHNVLLTTATASGKTLVFTAAAIDLLSRDPSARVLVFSPTKALATQLVASFQGALGAAGLPAEVARIDGDHGDFQTRLRTCRTARIWIATPDAFHAGILSRLDHAVIRKLLTSLRAIVIDEGHTYTGAFGTHAAYLLRRIQYHISRLSGCPLRFIAASATLAQPRTHMGNLTGCRFAVVGPRADGAPRHSLQLHLVRPPAGADMLGQLGDLLVRWCSAEARGESFAVFCPSRRLTEIVADCANRDDHATSPERWADGLDRRIGVYRAGLTGVERREVEEGLSAGRLRGVVCTNALELGVDFPNLTSGLLFGAPTSVSSFRQRLGRFGRHAQAHVFVVHDGSPASDQLFEDPIAWLARPDPDTCLYLDNARVLAQHAVCLRAEIDALPASPPPSWESYFPASFVAEYSALRRGEPSPEAREEIELAAGQPHRSVSLRDFDRMFRVSYRGNSIGQLTFAQTLREAFPGAVYLHNGQPWRVRRTDTRSAEVIVEPERRGVFTRPVSLPPRLAPDLAEGRLAAWRAGSLAVAEARCEVTEFVAGYSENRGPQLTTHLYSEEGQRWLVRAYTTTGVVLSHPSLQNDSFDATVAAELLQEAYVFVVPMERQDLNATCGRLLAPRLGLAEGTRFLALYDETRGSLRLTRALADPLTLAAVLRRAARLANTRNLSPAIHTALLAMAESTGGPVAALAMEGTALASTASFAIGDRALHLSTGDTVQILAVHQDLDTRFRYEVRRIRDSATGSIAGDVLAHLPAAQAA
jgi:DEAD/DEAH box helicase domain-containing protein